jgi:hypothetical protein
MSNNAAERAVRGIAVGRKIRSMFGAPILSLPPPMAGRLRRSGKSKTGGVAMLPSTYPHVQALTALATSIAARGPCAMRQVPLADENQKGESEQPFEALSWHSLVPRAHWKGFLKLSLVSCPVARPSIHPSFRSPSRNAATEDCPSWSLSAENVRTPMEMPNRSSSRRFISIPPCRRSGQEKLPSLSY